MAVGETSHVFFVTELGLFDSEAFFFFTLERCSCLVGFTWHGVSVARDVQERTRREVVRQGCVYAFNTVISFEF